MNLLEKIKINLDYLRGKADPSLYAKGYRNSKLTLEDWQRRWEVFSAYDGFVWFGVDRDYNIAEFQAVEIYVPEAFFVNASDNRKLMNFFDGLPEIGGSVFPENLRYELRKSADFDQKDKSFWKAGASRGLFIFEEPEGINFGGN